MTSTPNNDNKEKLAARIAAGILGLQSFVSARLNRFRYLKPLLVVFCIMSAGLSIYYFAGAIVSEPKQEIRIDRIQAPQATEEEPVELFDEKIPDEIYQSIQEYRRYMDSTGEGIRPGLKDSMRILEELYLQQQNK